MLSALWACAYAVFALQWLSVFPQNNMKFGVIVFPGSNCDHDAFYAVAHNLGQTG